MNKSAFTISPIKSVTLLLFVVLNFWGCNSNKAKPQHINEVKRISLASFGGMHSPHIAISVDSSLTYFFQQSDWWNDTSKVLYGKVSQAFWDTLNNKIDRLPPHQLDSNHHGNCDDCLAFELLVTYKNTTKHIIYTPDDTGRTQIDAFFYWLSRSYKRIELKPCFEITPKLPPPPKPLVKRLKVTPPHNSKHKRKKK